MAAFVAFLSLFNIAVGYGLAAYLESHGIVPGPAPRAFCQRVLRRIRLARNARPATATAPLVDAFSESAAGSPDASPPLPPADFGTELAAPPSYASPPSAAASPASSTVDRRGIERAAEPSRQRAGDQESAATEPVRDAESDVAPLAAGEPPVTEAQMLAGIEAFRAQLAELQQQPDYAS